MKITVYDQKGKKVEEISISEKIFGIEVSKDLLHQAIRSYMANRRQGNAHTKDRSEARGGGRKPWRQKGTGRARHGSIRSPLWTGGGTTFGPRNEKKYDLKFPKKMRRKALLTAISAKRDEKTVFILDKIELKEGKTKELRDTVKLMRDEIKGLADGNILLVIDKVDEKVIRAGNNLPEVDVWQAHTINALEVSKRKYLILTKDSLKKIEELFV